MTKPHNSFIRFQPRQTLIFLIGGGGNETTDILIDNSRVHNFAGVIFYSDSQGINAVQPTAGSLTFLLRLVVQPQAFQPFPRNVLDDLSVPCQVNWAANTEEVRVTLAGVIGPSHYRLVWAGNSA